MTTARKTILVLEDGDRRIELMRKALLTVPGQPEIQRWDNAWALCAELARWLPRACLISLDFDLRDSPTPNPGDGMDAVGALLRHQPACPIIIHTSLPAAAAAMERALRDGGWTVEQVLLNHREAFDQWRDTVAASTGGVET